MFIFGSIGVQQVITEMNSYEKAENQNSTTSIEQYKDYRTDNGTSNHSIRANRLIPGIQDEQNFIESTNREYEALDKDECKHTS